MTERAYRVTIAMWLLIIFCLIMAALVKTGVIP